MFNINKEGIKMSTLKANSCVINNKTGLTYLVTTDTVQTRNRRQVIGTGIRNPEITQIAESHLTKISTPVALVCMVAERIIRGKHKRTETERQILAMHKALIKEIVK